MRLSLPIRGVAIDLHPQAQVMRGLLALALLLTACRNRNEGNAELLVDAGPPAKISEVLYDGKFENGWSDYGWSPREVGKGPAKIDATDFGGWILGKPGGKSGYGGLRFKVRSVDAPDLEVRIDGAPVHVSRWSLARFQASGFPKWSLARLQPLSEVDGWREYYLPMQALNLRGVSFEKVVFQGKRKGDFKGVLIDQVGLTAAPEVAAGPPASVALSVDCTAKGLPISPYIYGVAYDIQRVGDDSAKEIGATIRRWGGNHTSRYNWQLGNAWNTASDYFFLNVDYTGIKGYSYETFFAQQQQWGMKTALTIPTLGWVAKDTSSVGFPKSLFARQQLFANEHQGEAGNGKSADGLDLEPAPQTTTSVASTPEFQAKWVETIRATDKSTGRERAVHLYFLDNEPSLWSSTHRDVHPRPLTYDELWEKTLAYAHAIRKADPEAVIAGPTEWGWTGYFFSPSDIATHRRLAPDRRLHGDLPMVAWWLKKAAEHEKETGERLIDVFDLHYYPQAPDLGIGSSGSTDPLTNALRIRSVRSLWDPTYEDESWIKESVKLLPRMHEWIDTYYPGRGISIGEYNFGADRHPSGGLAQAEALGRFGQAGVQYAFVWYYPPKDSAGAQAFKAFRNYDGNGSRFLDLSLPAKGAEEVSLFASRGADNKLVLIALNTHPTRSATGPISLTGCAAVASQRVFQTTFTPAGLAPVQNAKLDQLSLPPYSITVVELQLAAK